jgi:pilus assembly protein Flp/PilA
MFGPREEDGASAVEYGLLVAGIAALIVLVVFGFGTVIGNLFGDSCGTIAGHITSASCGP